MIQLIGFQWKYVDLEIGMAIRVRGGAVGSDGFSVWGEDGGVSWRE
jgi:hypothetical protein